MHRAISAAASVLICAAAQGQSFNLDLGVDSGVPSNAYGAVGFPGFWNSFGPEVAPPGGVFNGPLMDIAGAPTSATVRQIGANSVQAADDAATTGDAEALMDDYAQATNSPLDQCYFFSGIQNGTYEVLTYGWTPNHPERLSRLRVDPPAIGGPLDVGGAWTGQHVEGVTYARHRITVSNGQINLHSGLFGGNVLSSMNGIQIVRLPDPACAGDINGDGAVNFDDLNTLLVHWDKPDGATFSQGDIDGSSTVDFDDLNTLLTTWAATCS